MDNKLKKKLLCFLLIFAISTISTWLIFKKSGEEKPKVFVVLKELDSQYWNIIKAGAEKGFRDFELDGKVVAPSYKSEKDVQEYMLENIFKENPDVLIVSPEETSLPILDKYAEKNIPVLFVDTDYSWNNKTTFIGTSNSELGKKGGILLGSELQPGDKVAFPMSFGEINHPVLGERIKGAKISLEAIGIKVVTETAKQNEPDQVKEAMKLILKNHPDVKGVYTTTDINALNVIKVLEDQGYKIPVIGADGITEMIKLVEEGKISGTVAQNPYDMGYLSAETAKDIVNGKKVNNTINTGVDIIIKGNSSLRDTFIRKILK